MTNELIPQSTSILANEEHNSVEAKADDVCCNCRTPLKGAFCHNCGQSNRSMIKFFGVLFKELLDDVIGYDSRLKHTITPLLFKPGKITNDYIKDRRFYYVLPLRLYLITSVLFIIFLQLNTDTDGMVIDKGNQTESTQQEIEQNIEQDFKLAEKAAFSAPKEEKLNRALNDLSPEDAEAVTEALALIDKTKQETKQETNKDKNQDTNSDNSGFNMHVDDDGNLQLNGKEFEEGFLKEYAETIQRKWKSWKKDPAPLVKQVFELLPYMMFVILPIFALIIKIFYLFSKRYYVEHLILLIHNHSFIYAALMLAMGLSEFGDSFENSSTAWLAVIAKLALFLNFILVVWIAIYMFISLKRVYRQGWPATLFKGTILSIIYLSLVAFGFISTLFVSAYLA